MHYLILPLLISTFSLSYTWGTQSPTTLPTYKEQRKQNLKNQKELEDEATRQRLKGRASGRKIQEGAQFSVEATTEIDNLLASLPLSIQQHESVIALKVLNKIALGISIGVRAFGRWKEAAQQILSTNEQLLEAAIKSSEQIELLTTTLKDLMGKNTVVDAIKQLPSSDKSIGNKILDLLRPQNYLNTFMVFTDATYITSKADRWEQVKQTAAKLREEEQRFDDYIAMLQIKIFERQIMNLHKLENFHGATNYSKTTTTTQAPGYKAKLEEQIANMQASIDGIDKKIRALSGIRTESGGVANRLKKIVGKDDESLRTNELSKLNKDRSQFVKQMENLQTELQNLSSVSMSPEDIKNEREQLTKKIAEIKGRRVAQLTLDDISETLQDIQKQVSSIQEQLNALKISSPRLPPVPMKPSMQRPAAPQRPPVALSQRVQ